ncbi:hypothetical protein HYFRA_00012681 [Hymenoscyphus fraxineus]|uniref:Uncharacterized protein n=1 Tax=Hymenoscyphus fraxineus TaxID=746836 RepID=A0A9N9L6E6_9HELO|nr:hypothetical protein HYFRA_00012681 [Hymenoscyphus fraxineus]
MFNFRMPSPNRHAYAVLNNEEGLDTDKQPRKSPSHFARFTGWFIWLLIICGISGVSFYAGRRSTYISQKGGLQLRPVSRVLEYDPKYGTPGLGSSTAWRALIPSHGGSFNHPTLAPHRSTFSVFHQLQCLNGMREGYWTLWSALNEERMIEADEMPELSTPQDIIHCSDFLRQVLMCRPDLTLEVKNLTDEAVEGFGTERVCRDYGELVGFVGEWEDWGRER